MNDEAVRAKRHPRPSIDYGTAAERVAKNVHFFRKQAGLTVYELSDAVRALGRPIGASAVSKIEKCKRQVTVDDLAAISTALRVSPGTLLLPPEIASHPAMRAAETVLQELANLIEDSDGGAVEPSITRTQIALDRALVEAKAVAAKGGSRV